MKLKLQLAVAALFIAALLPFATPAPADAARPRKPARALESGVIPGALSNNVTSAKDRYIVVFKDDVTNPKGLALQLGREQRGTVTHVYGHALKGFAAKLPPAAVKALKRHPRIKAIVPDRVGRGGAILATGVDRVDADGNATAELDGTDRRVDADVAVLDSGVGPHTDLNVWVRTSCTGERDANNNLILDDNLGHGTHVAGTTGARDNGVGVVGVAPGASIWSIKVINSNNFGLFSWWVCGLDVVTANAASIEAVNMSLWGSGSDSANCGISATNPDTLHQAICRTVNAGVPVITIAGNAAQNAANYVPGAYDEPITVSALADSDGIFGFRGSATSAGEDDTFATFSNFGADVDIAAPGVDIVSTARGGGTTTMSGTSMAAPHVTGAAALFFAANPSATPADFREHIQTHREPLSMAGDPDGIDEGILNVNTDMTMPTIAGLVLTENSANQFVRDNRLFYRAVPGQTGTFSVRLLASDFDSGLRQVVFPDVFGGASAPGTVSNYNQLETREITNAIHSYSWNGNQALSRKRAVDVKNGAGSVAKAIFVVLPDVTAPAVSLIAPANGAKLKGVVALKASATDSGSGVARVVFRVCRDGVCKGIRSDSTAPYAITWDTRGVANGTYVLRAQATDNVGNVGNSTAVKVTVANGTTAP